MKRIILIMAAMMLCLAASAQITLSGSNREYRQSTKHSNTVIVANKVDGNPYAGFHGMVDLGFGPHVYSRSSKGLGFITSITGFYEFDFGLMLGAAPGYSFWVASNGIGYSDFRLMGCVGWNVGKNQSSGFIMVYPGVALGQSEDCTFAGDIKIGYRYMIRQHLGVAVSTGVHGILGSTLIVPLNIGIVF